MQGKVKMVGIMNKKYYILKAQGVYLAMM
jgi:hypothetical protein